LWLEKIYREDDLVGVARITLLALMRIVTNPRVMRTAASPQQALSWVEVLSGHPKSLVIDSGPNHWTVFKGLVSQSGVYGPSMTDAFLASLAVEYGATLCSLDNGFRRYGRLMFENPLLDG
jgi:predicted nucleic acid-binding protein